MKIIYCPYKTNKELAAWFCGHYKEPYSHSLGRSKKQKFFAYFNPNLFIWRPWKPKKKINK